MPTLHWLNDDEARLATQGVPYRLLEEDPALSYGDPQTQNMLIRGDNLAPLKSLLPYYAGQVKCIYIDPPYNTGSAFEHYDDNLEHSTWLTMMYPRLELLRDLLSEEGSIWISIDDTEGHYLKVLLDEIFGRINFVAHIVWQKSHTRENRTDVATVHDTILLYAKNRLTNRIEFHYTPKHGSWLEMAEIELIVLGRQCLDRRIPEKAILTTEVKAWVEERNAQIV